LSQYRLVLGAVVVSESAWLFSLFGALAVVFDPDGSPLSWTAVLMLLGVPVLLGRLGPTDVAAVEVVQLVQALIGAVLIYIVVGAEIGAEGVDLAWITKLFSDPPPDGYIFKGVSAAVIGALLWWRGGRLGAAESPTESLSLSFRLGMLALAVATTVDIAHPSNLYTLPMIFIFFASGLGGLSVGHLLPATQRSAAARTWPKVITGVVSSILMAGVVFSLIRRDLLFDYTSQVLIGMATAIQTLLLAVIVPLSIAITTVTDALIRFFDQPFLERDPSEEVSGEALDRSLEALAAAVELEEESGEALFSFVQVVEWAFVAVLVIGVLTMLVLALRRLFAYHPERTLGARESVSEDVDVLADFGKLLLKLVPGRLKRFRQRRRFDLPDGPPGVVNALRLYYELLTIAEDKGSVRPRHETPSEFQRTLEGLLPRNLVRMATNAFNRACYGHHPPTDDQAAQMRLSIRNIKTAVGIIRGQKQDLRRRSR
jgi:hypothetical protein